jgi:selenide,water dikinase
VLRALPKSTNPDLLIGFDDYDDAGVFRMPDGRALVQTMDFFTPIVDDAYSYGAIAAANALSDVYAMGGTPLTAMNIACFDPTAAPPETWAAVLRGMADKCAEAGVAVVGGHSVEDEQPKFGLSVTGIVNPETMLHNAGAEVGDSIYLTKPIGTGVITTAAKFDDCPEAVLQSAIDSMKSLNDRASTAALAAGSRCATDITGFGLTGHLYNIARASGTRIVLEANAVPSFDGVRDLIARKNVTAGSRKNRSHLGDALTFDGTEDWQEELLLDPQTSGGLAIFSKVQIADYPRIGYVEAGAPSIIARR